MMSFLRNIFVVVLSLIFAITGFAQPRFNVPVPTNSPPTRDQVQNLNDPYSGLTNSDGMYQQAEQGQRESRAGRGLAIATGSFCAAMAISACSAGTPRCPWWVACVGATTVAVVALRNSERKSRQSQDDLTGGQQGNVPQVNCPSCNDDDDEGLDITPEDPDERRFAEHIRQLERNGFRINPRTGVVTDRRGRRFSAKTFKSPERMRDAGISGLSMSDIRDMEKQVQKATANASGGVDKGEQGLGPEALGLKAGTGRGADSAPGSMDLQMPSETRGPSGAEDKPSVAGSSVNFNGVPIGVRVDNIFALINRRYDHEERREGFLSPGP